MSLAPGEGKTQLLYRLCAQAVLPNNIGGKEACAVVIDSDGNLSVSRLAKQMESVLRERHSEAYGEAIEKDLFEDKIVDCLHHIHIFRSQTLASTIATLDSLPTYLFDNTRHYSSERQLAFIAIDTASAFYWQDKAETEDANFLASTSTTVPKPRQQQSSYVQLTASLKSATNIFFCPAIVTTWYLGPPLSSKRPEDLRSFRPQLPALQPTLRLVLNRLPIRKYAAGTSMEQALREAEERQRLVKDAKFECFVNEWGLDQRTLQRMGGGLRFSITEGGLRTEQEERPKS